MESIDRTASEILPLVRELFPYAIRVVGDDNVPFFEKVGRLLPLRLHRYPSSSTFNGWVIPENWRVHKALVKKDGRVLFDGTEHVMGVATYSRSFNGSLSYEQLAKHVVNNKDIPPAYVYHCMWQYRPWAPDWALSIPFERWRTFGPGNYDVELETSYSPGEMLVAESEKKGRSDATIVFNAHTCHPQQANDDLAGVVVLIRLFQWLATQDTHYSYRLILAPEHVGTVFYLRDRTKAELEQMVAGAFAEMPGTEGPIKVASSFRGDLPIDRAFRNAVRHAAASHILVPWRQGAGNDETVWEAPGYEVPFVEVSRALTYQSCYPEYHTSFDNPDLLQEKYLQEFFEVFRRVVFTLENNATIHRKFDGLIALSNPQYDLYLERADPSVVKNLDEDAEKWGHLLDSLFRYFDGKTTLLEIADKHDLSFERLHRYLKRFEAKGLVDLQFEPVTRVPFLRVT